MENDGGIIDKWPNKTSIVKSDQSFSKFDPIFVCYNRRLLMYNVRRGVYG
jgi:hypothetical protein